MQPVYFKKKSYKQFLVTNDIGAAPKKFFFDFLFHLHVFSSLPLDVSEHSVSSPPSQLTRTLQEKIEKI